MSPNQIDPKTFRDNPFFEGLENRQRDAIRKVGVVNRYSDGDTIFLEGDTGDAMYLVLSGEVEIRGLDKDDVQEVLGLLRVGDIFGEGALLMGETRTATIVSVRDSYLVAFSRDSLEKLIETHPEVAARFLFKLLGKVFGRLRFTTRRLSSR